MTTFVASQLIQIKPDSSTPGFTLGAQLLSDLAGLGEYEELCWQYLHKLPAELKLGHIKTRIEEDSSSGLHRYEFDSRLFLANALDQSEPVGQLMVTLYLKPGGSQQDIYLELEQCQLWYPAMRGQGYGKQLVELVKQLGRALGAKALTAIAIYDGRFIWPALGFKFGDYLPEDAAAQKFRQRFRSFCRRHNFSSPDVSDWDAPDFARFMADMELIAPVGHRMDRRHLPVSFGRAFLLTRRPFFLSYPL